MYDVILSFITAFTLTYFAIPSIIHIAEVKNLCDEPGERRSHTTTTPSLGGIAIFAGVLFSVILWTPFNVFGDLQYILCAFIIIFLIGAKDDIIPMTAGKKMVGQLFAASILVFKSNVLLSGLHGVFGIGHLPYFAGVFLTIFTVIVIINSFNLIDGINGLSGSIGTLICITFGTWFFLVDRIELTIVSFALAGATVAFIKNNF
jgi:UDP-N-acetylmuramyl pentapeptide phosphotransferase/UDP-N-acetylglucosamine-1-phosphate transferase